MRDPTLEAHPKVEELRALSLWSEAHVWVSPEMHGCITGAFKNQIDWLPLNTGSVRPTQGRTCAVLQVNGGSQSFNAVNELRRLARWSVTPLARALLTLAPALAHRLTLTASPHCFTSHLAQTLSATLSYPAHHRMRMACTTNQSSVPKAWQEFCDEGRMKASPLRDRVVDVMEEHLKFSQLVREQADFLVDRYSERVEIAEKGRLLTQAEKEKEAAEAA